MTFEEATEQALRFRDERNWAQFHNPKDLAISISLESSELLELFQWSGASTSVPSSKHSQACDELSDVAIYCIYMADSLGVNLAEAVAAKLQKNAEKYPVDKSKDNARKYTEL